MVTIYLCYNYKRGIIQLSTIIPEVKHLLYPVINAAYAKQRENKIHLLTEIEKGKEGFLNAFLFFDGCTEIFI